MMPAAKKKRAVWVLGLMIFIGLVAFTAWAFASPAYRADALAAGFARFGDLEAAGLTEAELPVIAEGIAGYLRGDTASPQVQAARHGLMQDAFSQREIDHMPDVKRLTDWAKFIWRIGLVALALLAADALRAANDKDREYPQIAGKALLAAGIAFFGLAVVLAVWGWVDFTGLFYQLHQWLFPNNLWQLDPGEHLMIQLMPEAFFVDYALSALKRMAWLLLVFPAAVLLLRLPSGKGAQ